MILIAGLGNPGKKYQLTRHNIGFRIVDTVQKEKNFPKFKLAKNFISLISIDSINNQTVILVKPQTFMNQSGKSILLIKNYYKIFLKDIFIVHDDLDIAFGKFKIKRNQRSVGHKGVESIIQSLHSQNFWRIRVGIENRSCQDKKYKPGQDYVLETFSQPEELILSLIIPQISNKTIQKILLR